VVLVPAESGCDGADWRSAAHSTSGTAVSSWFATEARDNARRADEKAAEEAKARDEASAQLVRARNSLMTAQLRTVSGLVAGHQVAMGACLVGSFVFLKYHAHVMQAGDERASVDLFAATCPV